MSDIVDLSIAPAEFELGRLESTTVRFERCVAGRRGPETNVWVETDDHDAFVSRIEQRPAVEAIRREHLEDDGRALYRLVWNRPTGGLLECLDDVPTVVLRASGTSRGWRFRIRFPDHDALSTFQRRCRELGVTVSVDRILTDVASPPAASPLTDLQRETLAIATERGYFDVPRQITTVELAEELDVSDQAISARLRRATKALASESVTRNGADTPTTPRPASTRESDAGIRN